MMNPKTRSRGSARSKVSLVATAALATALMIGTVGCTAASPNSASASQSAAPMASASAPTNAAMSQEPASGAGSAFIEGGALDVSSLFTNRDLTQEADVSEAHYITLSSGEDVQITDEGVYVISGDAQNTTITVNVSDKDAKVQLVLDNANITNSNAPAIYVISADKVFITTAANSTNNLTVTGTFTADGETNTDAVIFSRDDLVFNGKGVLNISSSDNGVACKDLIKITGGTLNITSSADGLEANDGVAIADGTVSIKTEKDGINVGDEDDDSTGFFYMSGGSLTINAKDQGINAQTVAQIDGGTLTFSAEEGIEATYVQINGGTIDIYATDDGINAALNSTAYDVIIDITGGNITIEMASGDTDALDANGSILISGGVIDITAQSPFDYDVSGTITGGTVTVNGQQVTEMTNQMMGGGMQPGTNGQGSGSMDAPNMGSQGSGNMGGMRR